MWCFAVFWMCITSSSSTCYLNCVCSKAESFRGIVIRAAVSQVLSSCKQQFLPSKHHQAPGLAGWVPSPSGCVLQGLSYIRIFSQRLSVLNLLLSKSVWLQGCGWRFLLAAWPQESIQAAVSLRMEAGESCFSYFIVISCCVLLPWIFFSSTKHSV